MTDATKTPAEIGPGPGGWWAFPSRVSGYWRACDPTGAHNIDYLHIDVARRLVYGPGAAAELVNCLAGFVAAADPRELERPSDGVRYCWATTQQYADAARLLALARPGAAADDGEAVTGAWLVTSLGWRERVPGQFVSPRLPDDSRTMFRLVYYAEPWGGWHGQSPIQWEITVPGCTQPLVPEPTNRGDVRKLAAALGVPAGEDQK